MKRTLILVGVIELVSVSASARITKDGYVNQWNEVAVQQMHEYGIPASITLAQGILESASGNSQLAMKGNNHFGIKCHGWDGDKMYMDDDQKGECFRVYDSAQESYVDHSKFLRKYDRYAFLFELEQTNYKAWAKGLKKAGYATSHTYADALIQLIEDLNLSQYDGKGVELGPAPQIIASSSSVQQSNTHSVQLQADNQVKFVVAKKGDTFYKIAREFGLTLWQLRRYNDFDDQKDVLEEGDRIYVQAKKSFRFFAPKRTEMVPESMTVNEFSQLFGVTVGMLLRMNDEIEDGGDRLQKGAKVTLR